MLTAAPSPKGGWNPASGGHKHRAQRPPQSGFSFSLSLSHISNVKDPEADTELTPWLLIFLREHFFLINIFT